MEYFIIGAIFAAGMVLSGIGVYVLLESRRGQNLWFAGFALAAAVHCFGYAFELTASTLEMAFVFIRLEYVGIALQPFFGILATLEFTGDSKRLDRRMAWGLLCLSVLTVILVHTNSLHHLYYTGLELSRAGRLTIVHVTPGIWYWIFVAYVELCFAVGAIALVRAMKKAPADLKPQYRTYLAGFLAPVIGGHIYLLGLSPHSMDLAPCSLLVMSVLIIHGLNSNRLFNVIPLAQRRVIDSMNDIVIIVSVDNRIIDHNPSLQRLFPYDSHDYLGEHLSAVFCDYPELLELMATSSDGCVKIGLKDDSGRSFRASVNTILGRGNKPLARYLLMTDITSEMRMVYSMKKLANIDSLTQIANRRSLYSQIKDLNKQYESGVPVCAIMIDIDDFKSVNDAHGHAAGDSALREVASLLKTGIRSQDVLARYGGEEFIIIAFDMGLDHAVALAERLREKISDAEIVYEGHTIQVTASAGVAEASTAPDFDGERLIADSDAALYAAKESGKNQVRAQNLPA